MQKEQAEASKEAAQADFDDPIVTEITAAETFYPAEDYHQNYYNLNEDAPYCQYGTLCVCVCVCVSDCRCLIFQWCSPMLLSSRRCFLVRPFRCAVIKPKLRKLDMDN